MMKRTLVVAYLLATFSLLRVESAPPQLSGLTSRGEAFGGDVFRDARQIPIENDLLSNEFLNLQNIQAIDPLIISDKEDSNLESELFSFTPAVEGQSVFPSKTIGVLIPSEDLPIIIDTDISQPIGEATPSQNNQLAQNVRKNTQPAVGVPLPTTANTETLQRIGRVGVALSNANNVENIGVSLSTDSSASGNQFTLDRKTNTVLGVPSPTHQSNGIDLITLLGGNEGLLDQFGGAISSQNGLNTLGVPLSVAGRQSINSQVSNQQIGIPLPNTKTSFQNPPQSEINSGVSLPTKNVDASISSQDRRNFKSQLNGNIGVPLPAMPESSKVALGSVSSTGVSLQAINNEAPFKDSSILSTTIGNEEKASVGSFLISSQGQSRDSGSLFPTLPKVEDVHVIDKSSQNIGVSIQENQHSFINEEIELPITGPEPSIGVSLSSLDPEISRSGNEPLVIRPETPVGVPLHSVSQGPNPSSGIALNSLLGGQDITSSLSSRELNELEDLTIGDLLLGINGQNGIVVLPMSSVLEGGDSSSGLPNLSELLSDNSIGKSVTDAANINIQSPDISVDVAKEKVGIEAPGVSVGVGIPGSSVGFGIPGTSVGVGIPGSSINVGVSGTSVGVQAPGVSVGVGVDSPGVSVDVEPPTTVAPTTPRRRRPGRRRTTTPAPTVVRDILSDLLFSKGQWFGTLIGGMIDYGIIVRDAIRDNFSNNNSQRSYS